MITLTTLEIFVLACCFIEAALFIYLVISARRFTRKMQDISKVRGFKTSFIIEQALSLDL